MSEKVTETALISRAEETKNKLLKKQDVKVYPLTQSLRKELNELKDNHIGNLNGQLNNLKRLKYELFCKYHNKRFLAEKKELQIKISLIDKEQEKLREEFSKKFQKIEKNLESMKNIAGFSYEADYYLENVLENKEQRMRFKTWLKEDTFSEELFKIEFNDKYGKGFEVAKERIKELEQQFRESLVFGDLEMVKELFFILKDADKFLEKLTNMEMV